MNPNSSKITAMVMGSVQHEELLKGGSSRKVENL